MSRSYRRTPIAGVTTAASDRYSKTRAHRQARAKLRAGLACVNPYSDDVETPHPKETGNPWKGDKDGKLWYGGRDPAILRK